MTRTNQTGPSAGFLASCRKAALEGDAETQYRLGRMYEVGLRAPCDKEEAARWYLRAAKRGHAKAQYQLGQMYASGRGLPRDLQQAASWLRLAAEQCVFGARHSYLNVLKEMEQRAPRREQETPVRHGGQTETGQTITQEQALSTREPSRSKTPIQERSTSRFPFALLVFFLIIAFQIGNVFLVSKSDHRAKKSSTTTVRSEPKKAKTPPQAKHTLSPAQVKGLILLAQQGSATAQWHLGRLYENNKDLLQSDEKSVFWYHKAAQQGYAPAQYSLGRMYEQGRGVAQNGEQALFWYRKAAEQGLQSARDKIDALEGRH